MQPDPTVLLDDRQIELEPDLASRSIELREMYWNKTYHQALVRKEIAGCGQDTLTGHAKDFCRLLQASDPFIQPGELIVGSCLAIPHDRDGLDLGYYNRHYPPGHATILRLGLTGIRDRARVKLEREADPVKQDFLCAIEIAYDAACTYAHRYADYAGHMAADEADPSRRQDLERISSACHEVANGPPRSFHAALQLFQFTRVFGGNGCVGRFDQWMLPFYQRDLASGKLSQREAQELLECLFVKMNEFADVNDAALLALATNYRVGKAEVVLLGLFDDRATVEILKALIDWPTISAWLKKKGPIDSRWLQFRRWAAGRHEDYRPSIADLWALATGRGSEPSSG